MCSIHECCLVSCPESPKHKKESHVNSEQLNSKKIPVTSIEKFFSKERGRKDIRKD